MRSDTECACGAFFPDFYDSPHRASQHTFSARVVVWCIVLAALTVALAVHTADRSRVATKQEAAK